MTGVSRGIRVNVGVNLTSVTGIALPPTIYTFHAEEITLLQQCLNIIDQNGLRSFETDNGQR